MSVKIAFVLVVALFSCCSPAAHAATCTDTVYNNITAVQCTVVDPPNSTANNGSCLTGGYTVNGYATVTSGHLLIIYTGMGGPSTSITVSGNLGTGTWAAVPHQDTTEWSGTPYTFKASYAYPTSSGTLNLTFTCGTTNNADGENFLMEFSSSVGTVAMDCSSAWTIYSASTGPYGQTTTPLCVSTHANDLNISRINNEASLPPVCSGWTPVTEVGNDIDLAFQAAGPPGAVNCIWGTQSAQDMIVGAIALDDGSASPIFTLGTS